MEEINFDSKDLIDREIQNPGKTKRFKKFRNWYSNLSKNQRYVFYLTLIVGIIIFLGILSFLIILFRPANATVAPTVSAKTTKKSSNKNSSKKYVDPLDGSYLTNNNVLQRPPLAVMIENSTSARPQSGLNSADLVYEAQVEGGITRFMAVFLKHTPSLIGPIRSARLYYIAWAQGIGAIYTHWGGNIYALEKLQNQHIPNIDALYTSGSSTPCNTTLNNFIFCRLQTRYAPHNGYGNTANIWNLAKQQGLYSSLTLGKNENSYKFSGSTKNLGANGSAINVHFDHGDLPYDVEWIYNKTNNNYERYNGGSLQYSATTNQPITAKNVVVIYMNGYTTSYPGDGTTEPYSLIWIMDTTGSGKAYIFNNGKEIQGTWSKTSSQSRMTFNTSNGTPVTFQRGRIWFEIIQPQTGSFSFTPASSTSTNGG